MRRAFAALQEHPDGLPMWELLDRVDDRPLPMSEKYQSQSAEILRRACIAPLSAGWLHIGQNNQMCLTAAGRDALRRYADPQQFIVQAASNSRKARLALQFPAAYIWVATSKDRLLAELRAVRRIGLVTLLRDALAPAPLWRRALPVQRARRVGVSGVEGGSLLKELLATGIPFSEGGHAVYLAPEAVAASPFAALAHAYPPDAGLKIVKNPGGVADGRYIGTVSRGDSQIHLRRVPGHGQLTLIAGVLHIENVGPRLYDLVELQCGAQVLTAYVMQHVTGSVPSMAQCEAGVGTLRQLEQQQVIRAISPEGFDDDEFACPTCGNNALVDVHGQFRYIDFQNFTLIHYAAYLAGLRGRIRLDERMPGIDASSQRRFESQLAALSALLHEAGVSLQDKLVLSAGSAGLLTACQSLHLGAAWCHVLLDDPSAQGSEHALLALGCTRFSLHGTPLAAFDPSDSAAQLPEFLRPRLAGCVIALRGLPIDAPLLRSYRSTPFEFMLCEVTTKQRGDEANAQMSALAAQAGLTLAATTMTTAADGAEQVLAVLRP